MIKSSQMLNIKQWLCLQFVKGIHKFPKLCYPRLSSNQISTHGHPKQAGGSLKKIVTNTPERAGPLGTSKGKTDPKNLYNSTVAYCEFSGQSSANSIVFLLKII